ncbi:RsmB/NOP family class I SAM-dependent RNA methyltransferase [Clostridium subterminale]|uniref:RsmB/NOP family class I SAM-dependent RNA methyltransferase n=1 Tax=Clostridium subterminale TaxID=1550 RepID=A0ABN1KPN7_CLOSU
MVPKEFEARMKMLLKDKYPLFINEVIEKDNVRGLRVNKNKISVEKFLELNPYNLEKIKYNDDGFYLLEDIQMGGEPCHQAGMFYMQEPSAMIPVNSVKIKKDWKVLDLCAAPGGKTSQIANELSEDGFIISNDFKYTRCKALVDNIERLGLKNVIITSASADKLCRNFKNYFDMILVDATCSGEGMFRKNKNLIQYWSQKNVKRCVEIQGELLDEASKALKKDGLLVYSTCTFSIDENEAIVDSFLKENSDFELIDVNDAIKNHTASGYPLNGDINFEKARRFYPHIARGEGQFVAVMKKLQDDGESKAKLVEIKYNNDSMNKVIEFIDEVGVDIEYERIYIKNEDIWILPKSKVVLKKNVICYGVKLGELKDGQIIPNHQFFMAYGELFRNKVSFDLDDEKLAKYLEGYDVVYPCQNGWGVVEVEGCVVGGFKSRNNRLINLYPKNLTNKEIFNS